MNSNKDISHKGRVLEVTPQFTTVEIISESACSACHAKSLCGVSESVKKLIEVPTRSWENRSVGDEVDVILKASMGLKAVWLAYVVPLFVLVAVLLGLLAAGVGELAAGLAAIVAAGLYYFVVWLLRDKFRKEYIFTIQ